MTITLNINDQSISVPDGSTVLDAINASETNISRLCKDPDMPAIVACRTCLVQIGGMRGFAASCSVTAQDGMVVRTDTPEVRRIRSGVLELTLAMLPQNYSPPLDKLRTNGRDDPQSVRGEPVEPQISFEVRDYRQLTVAAWHHGIEVEAALKAGHYGWYPRRPGEALETTTPGASAEGRGMTGEKAPTQ